MSNRSKKFNKIDTLLLHIPFGHQSIFVFNYLPPLILLHFIYPFEPNCMMSNWLICILACTVSLDSCGFFSHCLPPIFISSCFLEAWRFLYWQETQACFQVCFSGFIAHILQRVVFAGLFWTWWWTRCILHLTVLLRLLASCLCSRRQIEWWRDTMRLSAQWCTWWLHIRQRSCIWTNTMFMLFSSRVCL